jgi:TolA-binding protein
MVTLEQVKLLETKVVRAIEYVERISRENSQLQGKLDSYQKRIDELEVLIQQFREDQGKIEEGILAALDRLNKFEDAIEKSIGETPPPETRPSRRAEKPRPPSRPEPKIEVPPAREPEEPLVSWKSEDPRKSALSLEPSLSLEPADPQELSDPREPSDPLADEPEDEVSGGGEDYSDDNPASGELDIF